MMVESREYPVHPGAEDCQFYLRTGACGYGKKCRYNHPKDIPPEKINIPKCKFFLRGKCKHGSYCDFDHSMEGDGAEHMPQGQKRHRTESKSRLSPNSEKREHWQEGIEKQSTEAQENLEEQRKRDIERQRREARLRLEQIKQTVHFDERICIRETLKELGFILTEGDGL